MLPLPLFNSLASKLRNNSKPFGTIQLVSFAPTLDALASSLANGAEGRPRPRGIVTCGDDVLSAVAPDDRHRCSWRYGLCMRRARAIYT